MGEYDSYVILLSCYYRTPIDRDYKKITAQDCSQVVTHYGGKKFGHLIDVTVTSNDDIVIVDYGNNCVVVLDNQLNLLKVIGQGSGNSKLVCPSGVAVTDNIIAVSDQGSHQVKKYSLHGELLSVIGCHGNKNGQFKYPRGLAFNNNKLLYVVDGWNYRVQVFQQDDTFAFLFGNNGSNPVLFLNPIKIAIDHNDNVLVNDISANCITIFTNIGEFKQTLKTTRPCAITISPTGYLIIGHDEDDKIIKIWSPAYQLINEFGKRGSKQDECYGIRGISSDSTGTIYVAQKNNHGIQIISS